MLSDSNSAYDDTNVTDIKSLHFYSMEPTCLATDDPNDAINDKV